MEWERAWREERAALMRLVALLHALAGLAERAAGRSAVVRGIVLWFLRRAEAIAYDFVTGEVDPAATTVEPAGNSPEDALHLAGILRALAWQLEAQVALIGALGDGSAGRTGEPRIRRTAARTLAAFTALAGRAPARPHRVPAPDTS